jgi:ATP-dependent Clp protease ATP-binding subunit ClpC
VLFIDELHTLVGAGAAEGAIDAANILKPPLARGELQCIGATTLDEYRKYIERDAALERRFQPVMVEEPTLEQSIDILMGIRERYEQHHKVTITDAAVRAAVDLSIRYITDRHLPDKAIDRIDEAASRVRLRHASAPPTLREAQKELDRITKEKDAAINNQEYEEAATLREEATAREWSAPCAPNGGQVSSESPSMGGDQVVAMWTGSRDPHRQEDPAPAQHGGGTPAGSSASRKRSGSSRGGRRACRSQDPKRPIGSFIFLGPTGVSKTGGQGPRRVHVRQRDALIKIDMSEFMGATTSPPGQGASSCVGFDEGGQLTRRSAQELLHGPARRDRGPPGGVQHPPPVLGWLCRTPGRGRLPQRDHHRPPTGATAQTNSSPASGRWARPTRTEGSYELMKEKVAAELKQNFPRVLNRIDATVSSLADGRGDRPDRRPDARPRHGAGSKCRSRSPTRQRAIISSATWPTAPGRSAVIPVGVVAERPAALRARLHDRRGPRSGSRSRHPPRGAAYPGRGAVSRAARPAA